MATISKTGIQDGLTSKAEHITRIIDALDGTADTEIIATGSFTGSFVGTYAGTITSASYAVTASYAENAGAGAGFPFNGDAVITGSLLVSGSNNDINFSSTNNIIVPTTTLDSTVTVNANAIPAGGHTLIDLSSDSTVITIVLPSPSNSFLGYEWNFDVVSVGGSGAEFVIQSGSSKIDGNGVFSGNIEQYDAVDKLTMATANSVTNKALYTLRSQGSFGWKFIGFDRVASSISSST